MADYKAPLDEMNFILFDVLQVQKQWQQWGYADEWEPQTAAAILEEAAKICEQSIAPLNLAADQQGCQFVDGEVVSPEGFKEINQLYNEGGWVGLGGNPEYGGMGMPKALVSAVEEMLQGACMSYGLAPMLTAGACLALDLHGSETLKKTYLEKMYSGQWSGAMDLTEPHAGTDLGSMRTKAEPQQDGSYRITGSKIFITWGEHDLARNIVHLVLARVAGAPAGNRGISLFLVPKFIPDEAGEPGQRNAVHCGALEHKMGIHGAATCLMNYDGATGWLIGEENKGLANMFTMMNYERLAVGIQALGAAHWSYINAVDYAKNRQQGKGVFALQGDEVDTLLGHADVRRMLLNSKAYLEAGRAFYMYVANCLDQVKFSSDEAQRKAAQDRVALLTPVVKAFLSDTAFACAVDGQQVFGGHGYVKEWGQEQLVRDLRITQIYEGTNGVQAMDLIGRKTFATQGQLLLDFLDEVDHYREEHRHGLEEYIWLNKLGAYTGELREITQQIITRAQDDAAQLGAVAVEYLNYLGHVCLAYMWMQQLNALGTQGSQAWRSGKVAAAQFYFERIMPKQHGFAQAMAAGTAGIQDMHEGSW